MSEQPWDVLKCVFEHDDAVYASVPLTSGERLLRLSTRLARNGLHNPFDGKQIRRAVFGPNKRDALAFAGQLRVTYGNRVVDPSRLPAIAGWTQRHYNHLWEQVIKRYCQIVCFSDGWQFSNGCVLEYVVAQEMKKHAIDARGDRLGPESGIPLMEAAAAQLNKAGLNTETLSYALQKLQTAGHLALSDPIEYRLTNDARRRLYISLLACAIADRQALLISKPLLAPKKTQNSAIAIKHPGAKEILRSAVFIDRSRIGVENWRPTLKRRFAKDIIKGLVRGLVLFDGWSSDADCLFDLYFALKNSIPIFNAALEQIKNVDVLQLVHGAISALESADRYAEDQRQAVKALLTLQHVA